MPQQASNRRSYMKKNILKTMALVAVTVTMVGCKGGSTGGVTKVKMSLMNSVNENPGWLAAIDKANEILKDENIVIEPEIIQTDEWDKYYTKVASNIAGRVGGTIGRIAESHIPLMINKKQVQDLTSVYESLDMSKYNAAAFEGVAKNNGKYYGLPTGSQHMVLYYNKDYIDRYNQTAAESDKISYPSSDWEHPTTFEEIKDMAKKLSSGTRPNRKFGLSAGPFLAYGGMYAKSLGGYNVFKPDGTSGIDSDEYRTVYKWFDDMIKVDQSMPKPTDTTIESAMDQFYAGNIGMCIDGLWWINDIMNPKIVDFNVGIAAVPTGIANSSSYSSVFTDCFFAVANSKHADADKKAIKALIQVENITQVASHGVGGIPVANEAVESFTKSLEGKFSASDIKCLTDGISHTLHVPYTTYYNSVDQQINQKMTVWLNGEMTSDAFVKYMHDTLTTAINKNNG